MTAEGVRVQGLGLRRDGRDLLASLTAEFPRGAATAVTGPSGAGKSTLLALLAGFEAPDTGTVRNPFPLARTGVVMQAYGLVPLLTAAENVELALQHAGPPPAEVRRRAAEELDRFGLTALADRRADELSGGQRQRLAIARALVHRPDLLLADEPTSELDPRNRERILAELLGLREEGVTVILATHDLEVAKRCDGRVEILRGARDDALEVERARAAEHARRDQRRRIAAQQEVVRREQARLADMQRALERLERDRGPWEGR